ncbi:UDP-2,3-diacylglucosamine diphosphatase [Paraglaciecola sp. 20A4]|uniref:UDP-2,3-diacylglucosamine diphosphatase n=1 Tax=Paraglaciecola sp. 20A4 TaxID=2687288 RepID=UPI00140AE881|nr:UDP-2,3-diacylglucosamine diphosphatase [Paraglaciecola sp. 20A4]
MSNALIYRAHYRTVWLSDIHLGSKDCKAEYLLDFLNHSTIETLYLVGDIIDMWAMSKQFRWPDAHNQVLHKLMCLSKEDTRVVYLPGNHDAPLQKYAGITFGEIEITREIIHTTADGRKLLVLHGDQFDQEVCFGPLQSWIGDKAYDFLLFINRWYNGARAALKFPYWSLAGYLKSHIKEANKAITRYKHACVNRAVQMNLDGVICGHIHHPQVDDIHGIKYYNDGDWIENCSALTELPCGDMKLVYWTQTAHASNLFNLRMSKGKSENKAA